MANKILYNESYLLLHRQIEKSSCKHVTIKFG